MSFNKKNKQLSQISDSVKLQDNISASEAWVFEDKSILATMDKSMTESNNGQLIDKGSFAKYINK